MEWYDGAVGRDAVTYVGVFFLRLMWECAGENGMPAEDFFHASVRVLQIRLVVECWVREFAG